MDEQFLKTCPVCNDKKGRVDCKAMALDKARQCRCICLKETYRKEEECPFYKSHTEA